MTTSKMFKPDYTVTPGEILQDILEARGISQAELARRCSRPEKTISGVINGNTTIMAETAIQFERALGVKADIWLTLDGKHKIWLEQQEEAKKLDKYDQWLKNFPIREMVERGLIPDTKVISERLDAVLKFFGVSNIEAYNNHVCGPIEASLRHSPSHKSNVYALHTWLREGEIKAKSENMPEYNQKKFIDAVNNIRELTRGDLVESFSKLREMCSEAGVAVILVKSYKGAAVSGAARHLNNKRALIQLSLRGKTDDLFWFSFFHESAHIIKHRKRKIYIENNQSNSECEDEKEADSYAANKLISTKIWHSFVSKGSFSQKSVKEFSEKINIAPGIVVGRLQKERFVTYKSLNSLKVRLKFSDE